MEIKDNKITMEVSEFNSLINNAINTVVATYLDTQKILLNSDKKIMDDIPINELDLSVRTFNCLKRVGIKWLSDIVQCNISGAHELSFLRVRNFGKRSSIELQELVNYYNLEFGMNHKHLSLIFGKIVKEFKNFYFNSY